MKRFDVIIVGAGAAGLLCASEALKRNKSVLILEKANKAGKKILISGGGRCNFTNLNINPNVYISRNPHFCKSAFKRFTQWDIIELFEEYLNGFDNVVTLSGTVEERLKIVKETLEERGLDIKIN